MAKRLGSTTKGAAWSAAALFVGSVGVAIIMINTASERALSRLEGVLFQVLSLGLGLVSSFVAGRAVSQNSAAELNRVRGRSAFRRVLGHYFALGRLLTTIVQGRSDVVDRGDQDPISNREFLDFLHLLETQINEQLATVDDAVEEWRDVVPDDVKEIEARAQPQSAREEP